MYVSGKTTSRALLEAACLISEMHLSVVPRAERKTGEAWQAAARRVASVIVVVQRQWQRSCSWIDAAGQQQATSVSCLAPDIQVTGSVEAPLALYTRSQQDLGCTCAGQPIIRMAARATARVEGSESSFSTNSTSLFFLTTTSPSHGIFNPPFRVNACMAIFVVQSRHIFPILMKTFKVQQRKLEIDSPESPQSYHKRLETSALPHWGSRITPPALILRRRASSKHMQNARMSSYTARPSNINTTALMPAH